MKIKEFDEKVRIGSEVVLEGKICHVRDLNRKTHEASLGRSELWVRCSEFELYTGGEVPCYVEEKEPPVKTGRPKKPVTAIYKNGRTSVFDSIDKASEVLNISIHMINRVLYGKAKYAKGIRFQRV